MRATKPPIFDPFAVDVSDGADPDLFSVPTYMGTGFPAPGDVPVVPAMSDFNWLEFMTTSGMRYLFQRGIADWDTDETDYDTFDVVRASNGKIYMLIGTATPGTAPTSDLGNWHLVLRDLRPMAGETVADPMLVYYNGSSVENRPVRGLDAFGFLAGRTRLWEENWNDAARVIAGGITANGNGAFMGPWRYRLSAGPGSYEAIKIVGPGSPSTLPYGSYAGVNVGGVPGPSCALLEYALPISYFNQTPVSFECMLTLNGATPLQTTTSSIGIGLGDGTLFSAASTDHMHTGGATIGGAYLRKAAGGTTWDPLTEPPSHSGGASTTGATTANRDTHYYYKCVAVGENDSPDGAAHVYHFLNGALVATHNVSMANWTPTPFIRIASSGGPETCFLNVGRVRCQVKFGEGNILL